MTANDIYAAFVDLFPFISVENYKLYRDEPKHTIVLYSGNYGVTYLFTYIDPNRYSLRTLYYEKLVKGDKK